MIVRVLFCLEMVSWCALCVLAVCRGEYFNAALFLFVAILRTQCAILERRVAEWRNLANKARAVAEHIMDEYTKTIGKLIDEKKSEGGIK